VKFISYHVMRFEPMTVVHFDQPYNNNYYRGLASTDLHHVLCAYYIYLASSVIHDCCISYFLPVLLVVTILTPSLYCSAKMQHQIVPLHHCNGLTVGPKPYH